MMQHGCKTIYAGTVPSASLKDN